MNVKPRVIHASHFDIFEVRSHNFRAFCSVKERAYCTFFVIYVATFFKTASLSRVWGGLESSGRSDHPRTRYESLSPGMGRTPRQRRVDFGIEKSLF